jgi:putative flavoprotein involved in K+ transport
VTSEGGSTSLDVVVIGASQAGLAIGYHLARRGVRFVILDAGSDVGHVWRSRWDSLTLFTPGQYSGLPRMAFPSPKDTYPSKDDVASYLQSYVSAFNLPVNLNVKVTSLTEREGKYLVRTASEGFTADQVVVATGPFQVPFVPPIIRDLDDMVFQIHSADYRHPGQLPDGEVLVVGGGNSGFQIAEELAATRKVTLAVGQRVPSLPQRLLGKDLFWWLSGVGFMKVSTDSRLGRKLAKRDVLIGSSPRGLRRSGVTLRKRLTNLVGRRALFDDGSEQDIDVIIWATGYRSDFSWIEIPGIKNADGTIVHRRGVTHASGLFFIGLPWQHTRGSALIGFVKDDAAFIAGRLNSHLEDPAGLVGTDARASVEGEQMAMEVDPVCGMRIDSEEAAGTIEHGGKAYYFCSQTCYDGFKADPTSYVT